jgi:hypothetical protein
MTRRPSTSTGEPDAPITGVAAGSLGTAANLDDTQVFSTTELQAAAAEQTAAPLPAPAEQTAAPLPAPAEQTAAPLPAAAPPAAAANQLAAPDPAAPEPAPGPEPSPVKGSEPQHEVVLDSAPTAAYPVQGPRGPGPGRRSDRRIPALAGLVAVAVLVLVAGAGILSTLDFGAAGAPAFGTDAPNAAPTAEPATPKPKDKEGPGGGGGGHGHNGCHGRGCNGSAED